MGNTIKIREEYFKKPLNVIKSDLNYMSNYFHQNFMNLELETVVKYEELIKILSEVLLVKMKEEIFPQTEEEKYLEIKYPEKGTNSKLMKLLPYAEYTNRKIVTFDILKNNLGDYSFAFLDACGILLLRDMCRELGIKKTYKSNKLELIEKLLEYSNTYEGTVTVTDEL